MFASIK